jgi:chromosome segregation ATPase
MARIVVEQELQQLQARLREAEAERQAQHEELLALRETAARMAGRLDEAETRVDALADVVRRQTAAREAVAEQLAIAERARTQAEATIESLRAHLDQLAGRAAAAEALLERLGRR